MMMVKTIPLILFSFVLFFGLSSNAQSQRLTYLERFSPSVKQTADSEARLDKWYRDAKYGAFIHFGVYSMMAGKFNNEVPEGHYSEWIRKTLKITPEDYHAAARTFNPKDFNADEWVKIFKDNGMKYVVITAKHHDGFALFDSAVSDFNIVDYTPFKRDIIKELSEATHKAGLKFGVYYSHAKDWNEPNATGPIITKDIRELHPNLPEDFEADHDAYFDSKSLPQVKELLTNYDIDLVWFDTPHGMTLDSAKRFSDLVWSINPDALINSRILLRANDAVTEQSVNYFDFGSIRDKEVPPLPPTAGAIYVESPDSVSSSYGYKEYGEHEYHSEKELIERLVHTVANGGNYLLNSGPMGNGKLDPKAVKLYEALGQWLKINDESIYDTRPNPTGKRPSWGDITVSKDGKSLYLHVMQWPASGKISIEGFHKKVSSAHFLTNDKRAEFNQKDSTLIVNLPDTPYDQLNTVVKLITR